MDGFDQFTDFLERFLGAERYERFCKYLYEKTPDKTNHRDLIREAVDYYLAARE